MWSLAVDSWFADLGDLRYGKVPISKVAYNRCSDLSEEQERCYTLLLTGDSTASER